MNDIAKTKYKIQNTKLKLLVGNAPHLRCTMQGKFLDVSLKLASNLFKPTLPEFPPLHTELIWPLVECTSTLPLNFFPAIC
jgi:hypothetical protein